MGTRLATARCCKGQKGHVPRVRLCRGAVLCHATFLAHQQLFSSQLLVPFTISPVAVVQERAMARIARLAGFLNTYPLPQVLSSWSGQPQGPSLCP